MIFTENGIEKTICEGIYICYYNHDLFNKVNTVCVEHNLVSSLYLYTSLHMLPCSHQRSQ